MKTLMIAASAAALLLAGAVSAQTPTGRDSTGSPPTTTADGATSQSGTSTSNGGTAGSTQTSNMPMTGASTMSNAPAGDAPSSYPMCTKRGQDRCKSTGRRSK